jgi:hypothetical protein
MIGSVMPQRGAPDAAAVTSGGWRDRIRRAVFPQPAPERLTIRTVLLAIGAVLAGTAVCLARTTGHGPFDSMWAEDGNEFYDDALNGHATRNVAVGLNGYFVVMNRLIAEVAALAPVGWAPAIMSTSAALITAILALMVYVASGAHLRSTPVRLLVAVPVIACPTGTLSTINNVATLQFVALYAAFWMLLWTTSGRFDRALALSFIAVTGLNTVLTVVLLPLALLRLYALRGRYALLLVGAVTVPVAVQLYGLAAGITSRAGISRPRLDPVWGLLEYLLWAVPYSILGERWLAPPAKGLNRFSDVPATQNPYVHTVLILGAYLVVLVAVVLAVRRFTRPAWGLVAVAGGQSVLVFAAEVMSYGYAYHDKSFLMSETALLWTDRYLVPVTLLLIVTMTALLVPRPADPTDRRPVLRVAPILGYAALVLLITLANLRPTSPRSVVPSWSAEVAKARATCQTTNAWTVRVHYGGEVWWPWVNVQCRRLRA